MKRVKVFFVAVGMAISFFITGAGPAHSQTDVTLAAQSGLDYLLAGVQQWQSWYSCVGCHVQGAAVAVASKGVQRQLQVPKATVDQVLQLMRDRTLSEPRGAISRGWGDEGTDPVVWSGFGLALYQKHAAGVTIGGETYSDQGALLDDYAYYLAVRQAASGRVPNTHGPFGYPYSSHIEPPVLVSSDDGALQITAYAALLWKQAGSAYSENLSRAGVYLQSLDISGSSLTQDHSSLILGLSATGNDVSQGGALSNAVAALLARQNEDGGWGETDDMSSNAYATGQAVYTLRVAGGGWGVPAVSAGVRWLLDHQIAVNGDSPGAWPQGSTQSGRGGGALFTYTMWPVLALEEIELKTVAIDIKPGGFPNAINVDSNGRVPVAILSEADFDAAKVDPQSVTLGQAKAVRWSLEDADNDGDADLVLHFKTRETGIGMGDTEATILGATFDGALVRGTDSIKTVESRANTPEKSGRLKAGLFNIGVADCDVAAISGHIIAISMDEREDSRDHNGDGDQWDRVLGYYDIKKKELKSTGLSIGGSVAIDGDVIVFELREDRPWGEGTLAYYSISENRNSDRSVFHDTGIKTGTLSGSTNGPTRVVSGGVIAYTAREKDFNGDGYPDDEICAYDIKTGGSRCTGIVGSSPSIGNGIIAYTAPEPEAPYWWWSNKIAYYDLSTGLARNTGITGRHPVVDNGIIAFESESRGVGYYDIGAGKYVETPLHDADSVSIRNGIITALAREHAWGDLNGDGDATDYYMVVAYEIKTDKVIITGVQGCCGTDISGGVVIFDTYEGDLDMDLNGDGDMGDCVQRYVVLRGGGGTGDRRPKNSAGLQWAVKATASSEYDPVSWAAWQATGEPNTFQCGDIATAWAALSSGPDPEWIELEFGKPVHATGLSVHETYMSGFIYQVDLIDADGGYHTVWTGADATGCPGWFELSFDRTTYRVKGARLYTQIDGWEEVDAVALISKP